MRVKLFYFAAIEVLAMDLLLTVKKTSILGLANPYSDEV
jgi:hypothetical protein